MKISSSEEYGLRCILQLARQPEQALSLAEISRLEGLSAAYAGKLLAQLRDKGLVEAVRGRGGGYVLSRSPERINVQEVLSAFGDKLFESNFCEEHQGVGETCVHAGSMCNIRSLWGVLDGMLSAVLSRTSLADLLCFGRVQERFEGPRQMILAREDPPPTIR